MLLQSNEQICVSGCLIREAGLSDYRNRSRGFLCFLPQILVNPSNRRITWQLNPRVRFASEACNNGQPRMAC